MKALELVAALDKSCTSCSGRRVRSTSCSMCHDSTWDHECDDEDVPCTSEVHGLVDQLRAELSAPTADLMEPFVKVGRMLLRHQPPLSSRIQGEVFRAEWHGDSVGVTALDFERLATAEAERAAAKGGGK